MTKPWTTAMILWSWSVILFGAVLVAGIFPPLQGINHFLFDLMSQKTGSLGTFTPELQFSVGLMGAVTLGWGLTVLAVAQAVTEPNPALWRGITRALIVWFVIDGAISVMTGFGLNAVSNTLLLGGYLFIMIRSGAQKG